MTNEIQFILYQLPDDEGKVQVVIKDETIWATQKAMAQLFDIDKSGISRHVSNIFKEGELRQETTVAKIATVVNRGIRGEVEEPKPLKMTLRHIAGTSGGTNIAELAHSTESPSFDPSSWALQSFIAGLSISTLNTESSSSW